MMRVRVLAQAKFRVVAVMDGDCCPALDFIEMRDATTAKSRAGFVAQIGYVAANGLAEMPSNWSHEANKEHGIFELIKGQVRLFYFKGSNGDIAVCTSGVVKSGRKADPAAVAKAIEYKKSYLKANGNIEYLGDEDDTQ